ncbi:TPA: phage tail protein [Haemophilus influenzae]|uniref:phage tail protein n=3 Tax=Pasteurellaceae TaxID=712 RepID=UPI000766D139|nr:phage tail protein [Haemophilus influenzae]MCK8807514.1 phage tail protein [Haemophilus influenzae]MCK9069680.1 phage tail protein [Haemophilus influenzae]PRI86633.1 phage tail fiber repeat protein [Haemophilus influenzae]PRL88150.1 phage tail fiber repeat protein [Haemophilus influenzae]RFO78661.1 hypothetical protein CH550_08245 [Haemophilus influenzae]
MKTLLPEINSADKRFHAGNPATGEQGTRVTDTWLNDVQDRVRDIQAEAHYVLTKAGFTPKNEQQTQLYQAIVKIIDDNRKSASVTQKGEVKLTSDTGLDSEELGLTAKAGKVLAQGIAALRLAMNNYIPLKSRSSSVTSNDENGVATPKAVKIAYDKAVSAEENNLYQKIYVGKHDLELDLTDRQQIINLWGGKYRNNGHLSFAAHNNSNSNITGLPLTNKSPIVMTLYLMGGYSVFYCDYPLLNRRFYSNVNFNNRTLTYNWIEYITSAGDQLINGTISANTPPVNATDDKVVTVGWAKQAGKSYVKKTGDTMTGNLEIDRGDDYAGIILHNKSKIAMIESTPDSENQFLNLIYRTRDYQNVNVIKVPKKTGTLALLEDIKNVHRRDYNRTINGTSNWDNGKSKTITLTGSVTIYPDGRIVQILHLKNFRIMWFDAESPTVGYADPGYRHPLIKIPLWSAMPNKILSAMPQIVRTTHPTTSITYVSEAGEWISAWAIREQGNDKGNVYINTRRFAGGQDEIVDLYVVIEGY